MTTSIVHGIAVLYKPDMVVFEQLVSSVIDQIQHLHVIDNTPNTDKSDLFNDRHNITYIPLRSNFGIAKAQNIGIEKAINEGATDILFLDQDSCLEPHTVSGLLMARESLQLKNLLVAAIGPLFVDPNKNIQPKEATTTDHTANVGQPIWASGIISSGSIISIQVLNDIGFMMEDLFIDAVDTEWCFRAASKGYHSYIAPTIKMIHSLGDKQIKVFGKPIIMHSDMRNFYITRNSSYLLTLNYVPKKIKARIALKLPLYVLIYGVFGQSPLNAIKNQLIACATGLTKNLNKHYERQ